MLDWIAEKILAIVSTVPALFGADLHHFTAIRAMAALLLIVLVVYLIAIWPFHSMIGRSMDWARKQFTRHQ